MSWLFAVYHSQRLFGEKFPAWTQTEALTDLAHFYNTFGLYELYECLCFARNNNLRHLVVVCSAGAGVLNPVIFSHPFYIMYTIIMFICIFNPFHVVFL